MNCDGKVLHTLWRCLHLFVCKPLLLWLLCMISCCAHPPLPTAMYQKPDMSLLKLMRADDCHFFLRKTRNTKVRGRTRFGHLSVLYNCLFTTDLHLNCLKHVNYCWTASPHLALSAKASSTLNPSSLTSLCDKSTWASSVKTAKWPFNV